MADIQLWEKSPPLQLVAESRRWGRQSDPRWHRHPFYELGLVLSGTCHWGIRPKGMVPLQAGKAILLRPGTEHCELASLGPPPHLGWIGFAFEGVPPRWTNRPISLGDDFTEIVACFQAVYREHHRTDPRSMKRVELALQNLLLLAARQAEAEPNRASLRDFRGSDVSRSTLLNPGQIRRVEAAAHYFRQNPEQPMKIAQVAAYHSLCPAHFSILFRRHHRMTPRAFLVRARLERARRLLEESDLTLKEIAPRCGFVDSSHLCKAFKKERAMTPQAFRNGQAR